MQTILVRSRMKETNWFPNGHKPSSFERSEANQLVQVMEKYLRLPRHETSTSHLLTRIAPSLLGIRTTTESMHVTLLEFTAKAFSRKDIHRYNTIRFLETIRGMSLTMLAPKDWNRVCGQSVTRSISVSWEKQ